MYVCLQTYVFTLSFFKSELAGKKSLSISEAVTRLSAWYTVNSAEQTIFLHHLQSTMRTEKWEIRNKQTFSLNPSVLTFYWYAGVGTMWFLLNICLVYAPVLQSSCSFLYTFKNVWVHYDTQFLYPHNTQKWQKVAWGQHPSRVRRDIFEKSIKRLKGKDKSGN